MTSSPPIRIMIVDDHPLMRDGLRLFVSTTPDMEQVAEAGSGEEALRLCTASQPDVVLMDLKMPGMGGVAAIKALHEQQPQVQILALTSFVQSDLVRQAMQAGAAGYLLKQVKPEELAQAIRSVHQGRPALSPMALESLFQDAEKPSAPEISLTSREREVLALLVEGLSNRQIAQQLQIRPGTVNFHVGHILGKLDTSNRTEAVAKAVQIGLLAGEEPGSKNEGAI